MTARAWLLDLDGVVYRGNEPIPGAVEFIAWLQQTGQPFLFLTNHSARTPDSFAAKLCAMGMRVGPTHVLSSAIVAAAFVQRERPGKRVFLVGEDGMHEAFGAARIQPVDDNPDVVVVGFDRRFSYGALTKVSRWILQGAEFIGTNGDASYPLEDGPAPECGALLAAIEAVTGRKPLIMGKPERFMYEEALRRLRLTKEQAIMVGDRLDTDIDGARRCGIRSVLVLSGATSRFDAERSPIRPDWVRADLAACRGTI